MRLSLMIRRSPSSCGLTHHFWWLSPTSGQIAHVFLTRPPRDAPKGAPFDLHALGTPPALILSQDQTLHQFLVASRVDSSTRKDFSDCVFGSRRHRAELAIRIGCRPRPSTRALPRPSRSQDGQGRSLRLPRPGASTPRSAPLSMCVNGGSPLTISPSFPRAHEL